MHKGQVGINKRLIPVSAHTHTHTLTEGHHYIHALQAQNQGHKLSQLHNCKERTLRCQLFCTSSAIASKGRSAGTTTSPSSSTSSSLPINPVLLPLLPVMHHAAGWLKATHYGQVKVLLPVTYLVEGNAHWASKGVGLQTSRQLCSWVRRLHQGQMQVCAFYATGRQE